MATTPTKKSDITKKYYVPYKEYFWGILKLKDGWRDLGLVKSYGKGEMRPYAISVWGETYSGESEVLYKNICFDDLESIRIAETIGKDKSIFYYCPLCGRIYTGLQRSKQKN